MVETLEDVVWIEFITNTMDFFRHQIDNGKFCATSDHLTGELHLAYDEGSI